jgi:fructokinase
MNASQPIYGGIEGGGTKFVCAVGTGPDDLRAEARFATTTPEATLAQVIAFFREQQAHTPLAAIGIGSFGPVDVAPASPTYGFITTTPKLAWLHTDVAGTIGRALDVPVGFDTDTNVAALGEHHWGAGQGLDTFLYLTVGTGIGGGGLVGGRLMHGLVHPEMGHIRIPHDTARDPFPGVCPYHGDCWEGLANGPAMEQRWGAPAETLPPDHPAWELEAEYLALALVNLVLVISPQRVAMGGGVMSQPQLFPLVRRRLRELLGGYVQSPAVLAEIDDYIVPPALGTRSGILGAIALAQQMIVRG